MCSTVQEQITTCGQNAIVKIGERTNIRPQKPAFGIWESIYHDCVYQYRLVYFVTCVIYALCLVSCALPLLVPTLAEGGGIRISDLVCFGHPYCHCEASPLPPPQKSMCSLRTLVLFPLCRCMEVWGILNW